MEKKMHGGRESAHSLINGFFFFNFHNSNVNRATQIWTTCHRQCIHKMSAATLSLTLNLNTERVTTIQNDHVLIFCMFH